MQKPDGMSDADFTKLHNETGAIFDGAVGFARLQAKDYPTAQKDMQDAVAWESQAEHCSTSIRWPLPTSKPNP